MQSIFEFLFKYRPLIFSEGRLAFAAPLPLLTLLLVAAVIAAVAVWTYGRVGGRATSRDRLMLAALRGAALAVLAFCLLRPTLVVSTVVPQQNFVGILIDDSQSMRVMDGGQEPRSAFVNTAFAPGSQLRSALEERFQLRMFRFAANAGRLVEPADLTWSGTRTRLAPALDRAREELAPVPLSGLIVVSDGADNANSALTESLLALQAAQIPVYTVGLGRERYDKDLELSRVSTPRSALKGASLAVDLLVAQSGFSGEKVTVVVEDEGRIVGSQEVELPGGGEPVPVRVRFTADDAGARRFTFRVPAQQGELVLENNEQEALIVVEDRKEKILYFEGEPRYEVAFMRRAVADDENLQLVVLQRTAENKYLRLAVDSAEELVGGFPTTRDELFTYRGLILGSVEASALTGEQQRMVADFVSERGGGLLLLGGRKSFFEGGYAGTPLEDVFPFEPNTSNGIDTTFFAQLRVEPTRAGVAHAITQIGATEQESAGRYSSLPELSTFNRIGNLKPGATALLTGAGAGINGDQPVLAFQRYGRGVVVALPVQDVWMWQMHHDIPLEDQTHETFWKQLLRWTVNSVPEQVVVTLPSDRAAPGEAVRLIAGVDDRSYLAVNNSHVVAHVTPPSGATYDVQLEWTIEQDGEYGATFTPSENGLHTIVVDAEHNDVAVSSRPAYIDVAESRAEYFGSQMNRALLERIAHETGGRFYTPASVASLAEDLSITGKGSTIVEEHDLWDMPVLLLLLLLLIAAEWAYRRRRGVGMSRIGGNSAPVLVRYAMRRAAVAMVALAFAAPLGAQGSSTHVLVISGLAGDPAYGTRMQAWATQIVEAARERFAVPATNVQWLAERTDVDPTRVTGRSTKEGIEAAIGKIANSARPDDVVLIVLFGHGSYQSGESRLSMPGPDLTAQDFAVQLDRLDGQKVVFANTASASGEFVGALSGPGRVIVTATRSGNERNATQFGEHFAGAFANDVADTDKDGAVSVLEAFSYARTETNRQYEQDKKLPTEHAVLDDNGDKKGTDEPGGDAEDGALAQATFIGQAAVVAGAAAPENASPALRALYAERKAIEGRLAALRARKSSMAAAEYEKQLEDLLVELSLKNQEIRRMEGGG